MQALIIVDIQNDFLAGGSLAVPHANRLIPIINTLQTEYKLVIATQDWHPKHHQCFASTHANYSVFDQINFNGILQTLWPEHCIQGSVGAQLSSQLSQNNIAAIFRKGMHSHVDSYSAFFDNGKQYSTGLADYLNGLNVTAVDICGLVAEYCVYYTARDALMLGFESRIINYATATLDLAHFKQVSSHFIAQGGKCVGTILA